MSFHSIRVFISDRALLPILVMALVIAGMPVAIADLPVAVPGQQGVRAAVAPDDWTQDGHDAGRTGYTPQEPAEPWTLAWTWNGPDANGGTGNHFYDAPAEARTVMGGSGIYAPAGARGIYGLAKATGSPMWNLTVTSFNAAPAYDPATGAVFVGGADGNLYKIDASSGAVLQKYAAGSPINKAVLLVGSFAYVATDGGQLHKVATSNMARAWVYAAGAQASTPPAYSASRDVIVFATADLSVHAIANASGTQRWGVSPSPNPAQFPFTFDHAWPVIAEQHGIVFLRMQLAHSFMADYPSAGGIYPDSNAAVRAYLQSHSDHKNLFALSLDDGSEKFVPAVGYGSTEGFLNGAAYGVMGSQPVVKVWPDGSEVVYIHFRDGQSNPPDYRWDGNMGEMVLDNTTVPGMVAGDLRFIRMSRYNGYGGSAYVYLADEQEPITLAGSTIFHAHWGASESVQITDRSSGRGLSYANPIETTNHPTVIRQQAACANEDTTTHWTMCGLTMYQDGRYWDGPGFWEYWNVVAPPGSPQADAYSAGFLPRYTYVSGGLIVVEGNGGELFVLRHSGASSIPGGTATPAATATTSPTVTPIISPTATSQPGSGGSLSVQVAASGDDVNEDGPTFDPTAATVWIGTGGTASASYTGLRFTGVAIPPHATIASAHLDVASSQAQWISDSMVIAGDATGNSPPFTSGSRLSQRALTTVRVAHNDDVQWLANTTYSLDDMSAVIQEIVNRPDWVSGNAISVIMQGTGGAYTRKFMASVDGGGGNAPRLVVTFTTSGATGTPSPTLPPATVTATPTNTPAPSTATPSPTASLTATRTPTTSPTVAPTATRTPTNTPIPPTASPTVAPTGTTTSGSSVLIGSNAMGDQQDYTIPGTANAFQLTASPGTLNTLAIYLDRTNTATRVVLGVYSDSGGNPATLLTQGTITAPTTGAWNRVTVPGITVTAGSRYWLVVLAPQGGGTVQFWDKGNGGAAIVSAQTTLTSLPTTWQSGERYPGSPPTAYGATG